MCDPTLSAKTKEARLGSFSVAERVYHSQRLLSPCTYFILYFCFFLHYGFCAAHQVCALSAQTCAPCAFNNAQVCDPTLSAKTKEARLGSFSVAERVGFEPTVRLRRTHDFQSCSLGQLGHLSTKFFIEFSLHHLLAKCSSCCAVVCIIARCLSIIR